MSLETDIKDILEDEAGLGLVFGTNLFIGMEPATPNNVTTIFTTPGFAPDLTFDPDEKYERPSIQIRVRNASYITGSQLMQDIKNALHGVNHRAVNGTDYQLIQAAQNPFLLDYDERNRPRFVCNFDIQLTP